MRLSEWLRVDGVGSRQRLHEKTGLSLPVISRACAGRAQLASATKIHLATGGKVAISSMTPDEVPEVLEPRARRKRGAARV